MRYRAHDRILIRWQGREYKGWFVKYGGNKTAVTTSDLGLRFTVPLSAIKPQTKEVAA